MTNLQCLVRIIAVVLITSSYVLFGAATLFGQAAAIPAIEREALIAFYNSTDGPHWVTKVNWLGPEGTEATWAGVEVKDGHVSAIKLRNNGLKGILPREIGHLTSLQVLDLNSYYLPGWSPGRPNQIGGPVPAEVGSLNKLQQLDLAESSVTQVPPELGLLSSLQYLNLDSSTLTSLPSSLGGLVSLTFLNLGDNPLSQLPPELGTLPKLETVQLRWNVQTGFPTGLDGLTNIAQLVLGGSASGVPDEVFGLTNLRSLVVGSNQLTIPNGIVNLVNLEELRWTEGKLESIPPYLGDLRKLVTLDLSNNPLKGVIPPELGRLTHLTRLELREHEGLTGSIPPELGNMESLTELWISGTSISGPIPAELGRLKNLTRLILTNNQLSGPIPPELGQLSELTWLQLTDNQLSGSIPAELSSLQKLEGTEVQATTGATHLSYFPASISDSATFTGYAFANLGPAKNQVALRSFSQTGQLLPLPTNPASLGVAPGGQVALLSTEIHGGGPSGWAEMAASDSRTATLSVVGKQRARDGFIPFLAPSRSLIFTPVLEGSSDLSGAEARTTLFIVNAGNEPVEFRLTLWSSPQGSPSKAGEVTAIALGPKAMLLKPVADLFGPSPNLSSAYVIADVTQGEGIVGTSLISFKNDKSLIVLNALVPDGSTTFSATQVATGESIATSLILVNSSTQSRTARLQLSSDGGVGVGTEQSVTLGAGAAWRGDLRTLFGLSAELFAGSVTIETNGGGVVGNLIYYDAQNYTYATGLSLHRSPSAEASFAQIASGLGVFTGLAVLNPGTKPATVSLEVFSNEGLLTGQASFALEPGGRRSRLLTQWMAEVAGQIGGYLIVKSTEPIFVDELLGNDQLDYLAAVPTRVPPLPEID